MLDNVELIDSSAKGYETGRIHSNLIRLKKDSFKNVGNKWKKFRISLLNKKLDRVKGELDDIVTQSNVVDDNLENVIARKTAVIARLEEKINVLSKENVPKFFVKTRAIKLKDEMIANVSKNSASAYATETPVKEVVEDVASDYGFENFSDTDFAMAAAVDTNTNAEENKNVIDRDQIKSAIEDSFSAMNGTKQENIEENNVSTESEDLSGLFKESEPKEEDIVDSPVTTVDRDQIEKEVGIEESEPENIKVSQNESTPAKIEQYSYGEDKISAEDVYKDMSEEELSKARSNIEYDKYEENYAKLDKVKSDIRNSASNLSVSITKPSNDVEDIVTPETTNIRDDVVVVADRDGKVDIKGNEEDIHFDYSEATAGDLKYAMGLNTDFKDLEAMKARALELKQEQLKSKQELEEARRIQSEEARRALEAKKATEEMENRLRIEMAKLKDYLEALEEDIKFNRDGAAVSREDAECNRRFIKSQELKDNDISKEISNINEIIYPEAVNVRVTRR